VTADLRHEALDEVDGDVVGPVVVVAVRRELALGDVVDHDAAFIAHRRDRRVLDGRQRVGATDRPAMPQAIVRSTSLSWRAISMRSYAYLSCDQWMQLSAST
jgi:hypothetical protein